MNRIITSMMIIGLRSFHWTMLSEDCYSFFLKYFGVIPTPKLVAGLILLICLELLMMFKKSIGLRGSLLDIFYWSSTGLLILFGLSEAIHKNGFDWVIVIYSVALVVAVFVVHLLIKKLRK